MTWNDLIFGLVTIELHPDAVHVDGKPVTIRQIRDGLWYSIAKQLTPEQLQSLNPGDAELWTPRAQWVGLVSPTVADFVSRVWLTDSTTVEQHQRLAELQVSPLDWQWIQTVHGMTAMLNFRSHLHEQARLAVEAWQAGIEERERRGAVTAAERQERETAEAAARETALGLARAWLAETKPNPNPARKAWVLEQLAALGVTRGDDLSVLFAERLAAFGKEQRGVRRSPDPEVDCECPNCGTVFSASVSVST